MREERKNDLINLGFIILPIASILGLQEVISLTLSVLTTLQIMLLGLYIAEVYADQYETPKRALLALIGFSIAILLQVFVYPGQTTIIIMITIMSCCVTSLISKGTIFCLVFTNQSRLRFTGKLLFIATILFGISMIIANFGSQKIWVPIILLSFIIAIIFLVKVYLLDTVNKKLITIISISILLQTGLISTIIQFHNIQLWELNLLVVIILSFVPVVFIAFIAIYLIKRSEKADLLKEEKLVQKQIQEKEQIRIKTEKKIKEIEESNTTLSRFDLSFLYETNKEKVYELVFKKGVHINSMCEDIVVSNMKKQIVWGTNFANSLSFLKRVAEKEFGDENLEYILELVKEIEENIFSKKTNAIEYRGEVLLKNMLNSIKDLTCN